MSYPSAFHDCPSKAIRPDGRAELILGTEQVSGADEEDPFKRFRTQVSAPERFAAASPLSRPGDHSEGRSS